VGQLVSGKGIRAAGNQARFGYSNGCRQLEPQVSNTIVVAISTKGKPVPFHVPVDPSPGNGLKKKSYVKAEQPGGRKKFPVRIKWGFLV